MASASFLAGGWSFAVAVSLQASVLLALAWLAERLFARRGWPQLFTCLWLLALARFCVPPEFASPLSVTAPLGSPALAAAELVPGAGTLELLCALWISGAAALFTLRLVRRAILRRRIETVELPPRWQRALERARRRTGLRRAPRAGTLEGLATPAILGLFRPTLLLPREALLRAPTLRDEHALLHELAHLQRGDLWLDELCALVRALLWFHPLVWLATARIHALSELACDQTVARLLGGEARAYRETLVLAARPLLARPAPEGLRAFLGRPNALVLRIERLERCVARPRALVRAACAALVLVLAACVLPMAPELAALRSQARRVLAAAQHGERQSCFTSHAAALVLAADSAPPATDP